MLSRPLLRLSLPSACHSLLCCHFACLLSCCDACPPPAPKASRYRVPVRRVTVRFSCGRQTVSDRACGFALLRLLLCCWRACTARCRGIRFLPQDWCVLLCRSTYAHVRTRACGSGCACLCAPPPLRQSLLTRCRCEHACARASESSLCRHTRSYERSPQFTATAALATTRTVAILRLLLYMSFRTLHVIAAAQQQRAQ